MRLLLHGLYCVYLALPSFPRLYPPRRHRAATVPPAVAAVHILPPTIPADPWRAHLSRPRAAAGARLTRALIVGQYNRADRPAQLALAAAGWPCDGYVI